MLNVAFALELGDEPCSLHKEVLLCILALCGRCQLLQHRDVPRRGLLLAVHSTHQGSLGHQLPSQGLRLGDLPLVGVLQLRVFDCLGQSLLHGAEGVQIGDGLALHRLAKLNLGLQLRLDQGALVNQLAVHWLVLGEGERRGDGIKLVEVQSVRELVLCFLDGVLHLHAPCHRLLLLCGLWRLVDHGLEDGAVAEDVQGPRAEVSQHGGGELLARGLTSSLLHGLLQKALDLRHSAEGVGCVSSVVLREDVHALRHEALGALQRAARGRLVQRSVADGVPLVV
mmetsp:Transcript_13983/g.41681  ORF Transcript_13983/g.41681 Transcript_13983/m.41681 type:complete len:283 (-) Transcript_13983:63-911(-)